MNIYLYKKTHRKTGLKYLGMTTKKDPQSYPGSGTYWKRHIEIHGNDVDTEILQVCSNLEELRKWGLYYSSLWNVVDEVNELGKKTWANLKEESGDGFTGEDNKKLWEDPIFREKMLYIRKSQWDDELKRWRSEETKRQMLDPELKKNWTEANNKRWKDPIYKQQIKDKRKGTGNNRYDWTIYHFINDDGTEEKCTRYELYTKYTLLSDKICEIVNGNRKSHKGWRVLGIISE